MDVRILIPLMVVVSLTLSTDDFEYDPANYDHTACRSTVRGREYIGGISVTPDGYECQRWDTDHDPHDITMYSNGNFPEGSRTAAGNMCRNPDNEPGGPWCYTKNPAVRWQYCSVPLCYGFVNSVEPRLIGNGGGVRVTLHGQGFAESMFAFGADSHVGNRVWFTNDYESKECTIFTEDTNENRIVCLTSSGMYDDRWSVRLAVNGVNSTNIGICNGSPVSWSCSVRPYPWYSPYVDGVVPRAGAADGIITIYGKFFTDAYGSNVGSSSNGREEKVIRVYVGGYNCELKNGDDFYGIALTRNDEGYIKCKIARINERGLASNKNVSVIIQAPFGSTYAKDQALHVSGTSSLFMYQSYAVIDSISHAVGSIAGGQLITITGDFFDETESDAEVLVGEEPCVIETIEDTQITCRTPPLNMNGSSVYPGNRGVNNDYFNTTFQHFDTLTDLFTRDDKAFSFWSDGAYWCEGEVDSKVHECQIPGEPNYYNVRSTGFFTPKQSGNYTFLVKADDIAILYIWLDGMSENKTLVASATSYTHRSYTRTESQISDRYYLQAGTAYYMECLSADYWSAAHLFIGAQFYGADLVQTVEGRVQPEIQKVQISSNAEKETLRLTLSDLSTRTAVKEVQTVAMTYSNVDANWTLGMNGAYTINLDIDTSAFDLQNALNDLPTIYPDTVSVTSTDVSNGRTYTVTFNSHLGDWPNFDRTTTSGLSVLVSGVTDGQASLQSWRLQLSDSGSVLLSDMINTINPTADQVAESIYSLFSARCPRSIGSGARGKRHYGDMESADSDGWYGGVVDYENEPFCGRASGKNVAKIYSNSIGIDMSNGGFVCFAYRGAGFKDFMRFRMKSNQRDRNIYPPIDFNNDEAETSQWSYRCINILQIFETYYGDDTGYRIKEVEVYKEAFEDIWVDEVVIVLGDDPITDDPQQLINDRRVRLHKTVDEVTVTKNETEGYFDVEMRPHKCANDFEMIQVYLAPRASGNTGTGSSSVSWGDSGTVWPADARITVVRTSWAAVPVTGRWNLSNPLGDTISVDADTTEKQLQTQLSLELDLSEVKVTKSGTCYGYIYALEWTQSSGDVLSITVEGSSLSGNDVTIDVEEIDGHVFYDPLPGDLMSTAETMPQVRVTINNIKAKCRGDCSYEWNIDNTPTITGVDVSNGGYGTEIVITGTGFSSDAADMMVVVGTANCSISAASTTEITCTLQEGQVGIFDIMVFTQDGLANGTVTFNYDGVTINSLSPTVDGSIAGGTVITFTGSGFTPDSNVTIGGNECQVLEVEHDMIICVTPAADGPPYGEALTMVTVDSIEEYSPTNFTYNDATTPNITSFTPVSTAVNDKDTLEVIGTGFGTAYEDVSVTLVGTTSEISLEINETTFSDTYLDTKLPILPADDYSIVLNVRDIGDALVTDTLESLLKVTAVSMTTGSLEGGTRLVIAGVGFGDDADDVEVYVGEHSECEIDSINNTHITCYTGTGSATKVVTNGGTDPVFGLGYAWHPDVSHISAGDRIKFQWTSPPFVTSNRFTVMEVATSDGEWDGTGFHSGEGTYNGDFTHQFNDPGTYYFTTGTIGVNQDVELRGKVIVGAKMPIAANISVRVHGQEAVHDTNSGETITESLSCVGEDSDISGCSVDDVSSGYAFEFIYSECRTPEVTDIDVSQGFIDTDITITGTGFSTTSCDNEVMIGSYTCNPSSESATEIVCSMVSSEEPDPGVQFPISVRVNNRGQSNMVFENNTYALLPSMTSISPTEGSLSGGTMVTITGAGFVGSVTVEIGLTSCHIQNVTYTEIVCETSSSIEATADVSVTVENSYDTLLPVECDAAFCNFTFSQAATPTLTVVDSPAQITDISTTLVVNGTGLGTDPNDVTMYIGEEECLVTDVSDEQVTCDLGPVAAGAHLIHVFVAGKGKGDTSGLAITGQLVIDSVWPSEGSLYGGQYVTVSGTGFDDGTQVTLNGVECDTQFWNMTQVVCMSGASAEMLYAEVNVATSRRSDDSMYYNYTSELTPTITAISPTEGTEGDTVTITGTSFSSTDADNSVVIGSSCNVTSSSDTQIECVLGRSPPGTVTVQVQVDNIGYSDSDTDFTFVFTPGSLSPDTGSFGGYQEVGLGGSGYVDGVSVTVCGGEAEVTYFTATSLYFLTPPMEADFANGDMVCDVVVVVGSDNKTLSGAFTYTTAETAEITSVSPTRGGTKGGTRITISGSNFGSNSDNNVTIAGAVCDIETQSSSEIVCVTNEPEYGSQKTNVIVEVDSVGRSLLENSDYWYIDAWSSNFTWGGSHPPVEGDFVVVNDGQLLLLDESTAKLKMLLINGGELLFDETDLILRAENILIVNGGKLTVGTEDDPFQHEAVIELHGQLRAPELPIYGAKCLAIRQGELNLHGKPVRMTWTRLAATASAGDTQIELEWGQADWPINGTIVISTTGDRHSQAETETRVIESISDDGLTITLTEALEYDHLGVTEDLGGGHMLEMRAEVGLLTRNVKVRGSRDIQWNDEIEACEAGFDTGEFATQTCFQGRFGDEVGSDQYGAQIMFHAPEKDMGDVIGKLSYIEVTYAGQAFRLGRYPVHFHLNGDMSGSYVRGLAIHETFNRAVNIHGTHNMLVEHTVIYNIMGGAFFLEDGIETGNQYYYNLALFVKASSSLLNDDITPAAFWATNPNNTYEHNAAAGGTHFGWWYRMKEHPEGPSFTNTICPRKVPLGSVYNNTVHSQGWFGLWTFQDYYPMVGGDCASNVPEPAKFNRFIVWNCEKGLEFVNAGSLQFHDSILANNKLCGLEGKRNMRLGSSAPYTDQGPLITNTVIAAYAPNYPVDGGSQGRFAIILPWSEGFSVSNMTFINFDSTENTVFKMTSIQGTCSELCGGWNYHFSDFTFINGDQHLAQFRWLHDGVFVDKDGTFSGMAGDKILPWMDTMDPSKCQRDSRFSYGEVDGAVCDNTTQFARMSWNNPNMEGMKFKDVIFTNDFGSHRTFFADKRMTHPKGWTGVVQLGETYKVVWENLEHMVNMSYTAGFNDMIGGGVVITHNMTSKPDRFQVIPGNEKDMDEAKGSRLSYENDYHGDFYFNDNEKEISYLISDQTDPASRRKRTVDENTYLVHNVLPNAYRCYWPDCQPPPDQNTLPPITERPDYAIYWSNTSIWDSGQLPSDGDEVTIPSGRWVVADVEFPKLRSLVLEGNLEVDDTQDNVLEVDFIVILGGRLVVGWEDNRFMHNMEIVLHGSQNDEPWPQSSGTTVGNKAIAVYGGLDLHGKQRSTVQSYLTQTADAGTDLISVGHDVDWLVGEKLAVATTSFNSHETEVVEITAVDGRTITVTPAFAFKHLGNELTDEAGNHHRLAAEVMLVTRNVVVRGGEHTDMVRLGYGGRILVGNSQIGEGIDTTRVTGWARISFTQFSQMGQLGFSESFDARFTITFDQTGVVTNIKPSYLKSNSFYDGYSPQIGFYGAEKLVIQDNCMYKVVGGGMIVTGQGHTIDRNLIMHNLWPGTYEGRRELKNVAYEASFNLERAGFITFRDNKVAGSERVGYRVHGEPCEGQTQTSLYESNSAHSCMFGVMMEEGNEISTVCFKIHNYNLWKNYDYGIWVQTPSNGVELINNNLIENGLGVFTLTFKPASLSHVSTHNLVRHVGGFVSGPTEWFDGTVDVKPNDDNYGLSGLARSWRINRLGFVGIGLHNGESGPNGQPTHPFSGRMSYPLINAEHRITDVRFANFKSRTVSGQTVNDFAISSNPASDDITHPAYIEGAVVESSAEKSNLIHFHRSRLGKVNPSDCVDMDCDGHKKLLVEDKDGSFLGSPGTVVDDAAWQWDGNPAYGLGDYRIPKVMLTYPNSTRMDPPPNKGIYRGDNCTWHSTWQAYECYGTIYRQVVIESMDQDTELRRLSPIGVKERSGDWIDLLNGPQDHGWCAGYTCQKRISTFWAVLAMGHTYDIYLTSTNPQRTRFYILHADDTESVRLAVYYHSPQRLDIFADDTYIYPTNAEITNDGNYNLKTATQDPPEWLPALDGVAGGNYFDREWQLQYLLLKGDAVIDVIIKEVVVVSLSMPPMTIDDFFGENIVNNLATFLGVPANKIRIVDVVRETPSRKRDTESTTLQIEIGDAPSNGQNISEVNNGELKRDALVNLTRKVVDSVQLGTLGSSLNLTILGIEVQEPLPPPQNSTDSDWANLANSSSLLAAIQIPSRMEYHLPLVAQREQQPFPTQPEFSMYDANDDLVMILGSRADPWKIRATLRSGGSDPDAVLIGNDVCGFKDGVCAFENLGISHSGSGYIIDFEIFDPAEAVYSDVSASISVSAAVLTAGFDTVPDKNEPLMEDEIFTTVVDIRDFGSLMPLDDIAWKGHTWEVTLSIYTPGMSPDGAVLSGTLTKAFDAADGIATFDDLSLNVRGRYSLLASVRSTPNDYSFTGRSTVIDVKSNMTRQAEQVSYNVTLKIDEDYNAVADGKEDLIEALVYNYLLNIDETARYSDFLISSGSVMVLFWVTGESTDVLDILTEIETDVTSGLTLTFPGGSSKTFAEYLAIDDDVLFDEATVTTTAGVSEKPVSKTAAIIAGSISAVFAVLLVVVVVVILMKKKNRKVQEDPAGNEDAYRVPDQSRPASNTNAGAAGQQA